MQFFSLLTEILFSPILIGVSVLVVWLFCHLTLVYFSKNITEKKLRILEILYIFAGIIGLCGIASKNETIKLEVEQENIKFKIRYWEEQIKQHWDYFCINFTKGDYSPADIEKRIEDRSSLCKWAQKEELAQMSEKTIEGISLREFNLINRDSFLTDTNDQLIEWYNNDVTKANELILKFKQNMKNVNNSRIGHYETLGLLFMVLALGLRLSITSYRLLDIKQKR